MKPVVTASLRLAFILIAAAAASSALAQGAPGKTGAGGAATPGYEVTSELQRYREMAGVMRDMSQQMSKLQEELAKGEPLPERKKGIKRQLEEMADITKHMSGLLDRPSMKAPEVKKLAAQMREQMDRLMRDQP